MLKIIFAFSLGSFFTFYLLTNKASLSPNNDQFNTQPQPEIASAKLTTMTPKMKSSIQEPCPKVFTHDNHRFQTFDSHQYTEIIETKLKDWENSVKEVFKNSDSDVDPDENFKKYIDIKSELEKELAEFDKKTKQFVNISSGIFVATDSYEYDLNRIKIRKKYHDKLKKEIGPNAYRKIRENLFRYNQEKIENARRIGENYWPWIKF